MEILLKLQQRCYRRRDTAVTNVWNIFNQCKDTTKGQLTLPFCERLFCSLSNARIGAAEHPSGRVDSGIFLAVCGRPAAVEKTRRKRRVHATATSRLRPHLFFEINNTIHFMFWYKPCCPFWRSKQLKEVSRIRSIQVYNLTDSWFKLKISIDYHHLTSAKKGEKAISSCSESICVHHQSCL